MVLVHGIHQCQRKASEGVSVNYTTLLSVYVSRDALHCQLSSDSDIHVWKPMMYTRLSRRSLTVRHVMPCAFKSRLRPINFYQFLIRVWLLYINCTKSTCVAFGSHYKKDLPTMSFGGQPLLRSKSLKYLRVNFLSVLHNICDIDYISHNCASNCVFAYSNGLSELLQLYLQQSFCLPMQYAYGSLRLSNSQIQSLNVCWNNVFR